MPLSRLPPLPSPAASRPPPRPRQAHSFHHGWGSGAGLLGAAVVGSAIAASNPYPYGYQRCDWVRQFDAFGNYIGTVRSCY